MGRGGKWKGLVGVEVFVCVKKIIEERFSVMREFLSVYGRGYLKNAL